MLLAAPSQVAAANRSGIVPLLRMQLPKGLSTATGLTALTIDNYCMSLDEFWEELAELLPHLPLLQASAMVGACVRHCLAQGNPCPASKLNSAGGG